MDRSWLASARSFGSIVVRPVRTEERERWRQLMRTHHYLGLTRGFAMRGRGYVAYGQPKQVFVRVLDPQARHFLHSPLLAPLPSSRKENGWMIDVNRLPLDGEGGLIEALRTVVDPRKPRGVRHPAVTVVAIAVSAASTPSQSGRKSLCDNNRFAFVAPTS